MHLLFTGQIIIMHQAFSHGYPYFIVTVNNFLAFLRNRDMMGDVYPWDG